MKRDNLSLCTASHLVHAGLYYIRYLFRIVACLGDDEKCMFLHSRSSAPRCQGHTNHTARAGIIEEI